MLHKLLLFFSLSFIPFSLNAQTENDEPVISYYVDVFSVTPAEKLWMIDDKGRTYYSNTINSDWQKAKPVIHLPDTGIWSPIFKKISFFNSDTAILTGHIALNVKKHNLNGLYYTKDGCKSWNIIDFKGNTGILGIYLKKNGEAWIGGVSGKIIYSNDYGQHWQILNTLFKAMQQINCVDMFNSQTGVSGSLHNGICITNNNWSTFKQIPTPLDQGKYTLVPYSNTDEIKKVILWNNYLIVKQDQHVFYSDSSHIEWQTFSAPVIDFELDKESNKLYAISKDSKILYFNNPTEYKMIGSNILRSEVLDLEVINHSLYVMCKPHDVYKINEKGFACRTPFAYNSYCEDKKAKYISKETAIKIAKKRWPFVREQSGWSSPRAVLDTATTLWKIETDKLTYRHWGKTIALSKTDRCQPCKKINGCHVIRVRTIWINALNGKVKRKEKSKTVSGNYE